MTAATDSFEAMQYIEPDPLDAIKGLETEETCLGTFSKEDEAVGIARAAWKAYRDEGRDDVAWWLVRVPGESLARWIADSGSRTERVVDLRTGKLIDVP
jgi:hypothetical protein